MKFEYKIASTLRGCSLLFPLLKILFACVCFLSSPVDTACLPHGVR